MAALSDVVRRQVLGRFMSEKSALREGIATVTKAELLAAVNGIDAWIEANAAEFNAAIPEPARGALTAQQKVDLFLLVLLRRVRG